MAARTVVVDLDGTVWDSRPWYAALLAARQSAWADGRPVARLLTDAGYTKAQFARACGAKSPRLQLYEGAADALASLAEAGDRFGVVTNLPGWMALPMLGAAGLDVLLPVVVPWGATSRHKPHPDPLLAAFRSLGAAPAASWYVGDDPVDARTAAAAGARFAWASWGYSHDAPPHTDRVLNAPSEIRLLP